MNRPARSLCLCALAAAAFFSAIPTAHAQTSSACPCDINGDRRISAQDLFDYLARFFSGSRVADFNGDGVVSSQDLFDMLACFFTGCADQPVAIRREANGALFTMRSEYMSPSSPHLVVASDGVVEPAGVVGPGLSVYAVTNAAIEGWIDIVALVGPITESPQCMIENGLRCRTERCPNRGEICVPSIIHVSRDGETRVQTCACMFFSASSNPCRPIIASDGVMDCVDGATCPAQTTCRPSSQAFEDGSIWHQCSCRP